MTFAYFLIAYAGAYLFFLGLMFGMAWESEEKPKPHELFECIWLCAFWPVIAWVMWMDWRTRK